MLVRRQDGRALEGERGGDEAAALPRALRGPLELAGDGGVRVDGRRGSVPGTAVGLRLALKHAREGAVCSLAPGERCRLVDGRADQRMAELEPRGLDAD